MGKFTEMFGAADINKSDEKVIKQRAASEQKIHCGQCNSKNIIRPMGDPENVACMDCGASTPISNL